MHLQYIQYSLREHLHCKIIKCIVENYFILGSRPEPIMLALFRIIRYKFGKKNAGIIGSIASIIKDLLGTKIMKQI